MQDINTCQKIRLPQGAIYLGESDKSRSVGYLELHPHTSLTLHNRPTEEVLTQVQGKTSIIEYDEKGNCAEQVLKKGEKHTIAPAGKYHIHVNPFKEKSITYWDFPGDITEIIESIRNISND